MTISIEHRLQEACIVKRRCQKISITKDVHKKLLSPAILEHICLDDRIGSDDFANLLRFEYAKRQVVAV